MRSPHGGLAALLIGILAVSGCAAASPAEDADAGSAVATSSAPSAQPPSTAASPPSTSDEPAAVEEPAPGAYLDYVDGIIEKTAGTKALFFHASWCPNCRQLDDELTAEGAPDGLTVFKVDFDSRTDLRQKYGVTLQTTVVFVDDAGDAISSSVLYDDPSLDSLVAAIP